MDRVVQPGGRTYVAAYMAIGAELSLGPAIRALHDAGFQLALPVCGPEASMEFCPWVPGDELDAGPYGIGEPRTAPIDLTMISTLLVPGVGFATDGSRIGHGMGYYDRFFARCFAVNHDPRRLGIAHDCQIVKLPPAEPWDVAMHEVITPSKVFHVTN